MVVCRNFPRMVLLLPYIKQSTDPYHGSGHGNLRPSALEKRTGFLAGWGCQAPWFGFQNSLCRMHICRLCCIDFAQSNGPLPLLPLPLSHLAKFRLSLGGRGMGYCALSQSPGRPPEALLNLVSHSFNFCDAYKGEGMLGWVSWGNQFRMVSLASHQHVAMRGAFSGYKNGTNSTLSHGMLRVPLKEAQTSHSACGRAMKCIKMFARAQ